MGKASRRKQHPDHDRAARPAAYTARPFAGLAGETDWVALKEILPAATAPVRLATPKDDDGEVPIATVLPMAWAGLRRADGVIFAATQGGNGSGDASRDLAAGILAALAAEPGAPVTQLPLATDATPRLQDLIDVTQAPDVTVHAGFDFWVEGQELDEAARASLDQANGATVPTTKMSAAPSAYWCLLGGRSHLRLVLPDDEDNATDALARLAAAGTSSLGDGTRLLGAFRACGLLIPVWELVGDTPANDYEEALTSFTSRYAAALTDAPLTSAERRARAGLLSRQVTLR